MDWTKVNWTKSVQEIAAETGRAVSTIQQYRYKYGTSAAQKPGGAYKPFTIGSLRKMKLPGLIVTVGKERLALNRLKRLAPDIGVAVAPGDFMEAWQQKGLNIFYPTDETVMKVKGK